jgi:hypothetical protein
MVNEDRVADLKSVPCFQPVAMAAHAAYERNLVDRRARSGL